MAYIMAQVFGASGFLSGLIAYQQNTHKGIVLFQMLGNICFLLNYYLLGAYTGALLSILCLIRNLVYFFKDRRWGSSPWWIVFFVILSVVSNVLTWDGIRSLLPTVGTVMTCIAFGIKNPKVVRRLALPASPLWLIYGVMERTYGGVLNECFNMVSILIAMYRFDRKSSKGTEQGA